VLSFSWFYLFIKTNKNIRLTPVCSRKEIVFDLNYLFDNKTTMNSIENSISDKIMMNTNGTGGTNDDQQMLSMTDRENFIGRLYEFISN